MTEEWTQTPLQQLIDIMARLRSAQGCRWDRQQTPESLKPYLLEECYELLEAIDRGQPQEICDELGDLLLQVVFQAQIFSERGDFAMQDVAAAINKKLIRRHPHIFASANAEGHEERWEEIKLQERKERGQPTSLAERIPTTFPALKRAQKIAKRCPFSDNSTIIAKVKSQLSSLGSQIIDKTDACGELQASVGTLLFHLVQLANNLGVDAEESLRQTNAEKVAMIDAK